MAIQLLGIPFIAGAFSSIFIAVVNFFGKFFSKKIAVAIAGVAAVVTVTGTFIAAMAGLLAAIEYAAPDFGPIMMFLPDNMAACFGTIISASVLRWAYEWNIKIIQWKLF